MSRICAWSPPTSFQVINEVSLRSHELYDSAVYSVSVLQNFLRFDNRYYELWSVRDHRWEIFLSNCITLNIHTVYLFNYPFIHWVISIQGVPGECATHRENVPYVKVHRYNPKHQIRIWTVTEIMAREVLKYDSCYTLID